MRPPALIFDTSVTLAWALEDEETGYPDFVLESLAEAKACVPITEPLEAGKALPVAERLGRLNQAATVQFLALLWQFPIVISTPCLPLAHETLTNSLFRTPPVPHIPPSYLPKPETRGPGLLPPGSYIASGPNLWNSSPYSGAIIRSISGVLPAISCEPGPWQATRHRSLEKPFFNNHFNSFF